ncbi:MAG: pectinesterase family protein [Clostridia bacterium]|nr:pectinesterase family protein [Clostridia bacterium]
MHVGDEPEVLTASGEDKNGKAFASSDYSWSSEGDAIAISKVGYLCEVTALKPGTGTVTVKAGKFSAWCDVVVLDTVESVTLDKSTLELSVGGSDTLTAEVTLTLGGAYSGSYEWNVTKGEDIIGISPSGDTCTVTAEKAGDATITVTVEGVSVGCDVKVTETSENEHSYSQDSKISWSWIGSDEEGWTATATVKCDNCDYTVDAIVEMTTETAKATCTEAGKTVYTATAKLEGETYEWTTSKEVSIPATGHTYPEENDENNVLWDWENISEGKVEVTIKCAVCGAVIASEKISYSEDANNPGYWVASFAVGEKTYESSFEIPKQSPGETYGEIVKIDFDSERFTSGTVYVQKKDDEHPDEPTSASLTYNDGTETGFTAVGEASDSSTIEIATENASDDSHTVLKFNGGATTTKGSISIELQQGYYCVVLTYFQSNAGRWATVLDSRGNDLAPYIAEEDKTTSDSSQKTRTIYFYLDSAQSVYIGSHDSGLYITSIGIYGVDSVGEMIVEGVSLDVSEAEIVEGEEIVLTALVKLSDGKTYKGYDLVEYTWTSEPEGYVPENYTSDNITISGQGIGTVKVTVTIVVGSNVYSDNCVITVTEKVEEEIPELGEALEHIYIDFSDESTYSWIEDVVSGNAYTSGIMTFYTGTESQMSISNGYLNTYGGSSTGNGRYFTIDLSGYEGQYITVNVSFTGNGTSERYLILATELVSDITTNPDVVLTSVKTASTGTEYTLSFSGAITANMATIYLTCSNGMRIYNMSIDVFEVVESSEPRVTGVELSSDNLTLHIGDGPVELKATAVMNTKDAYTGEYEWILSDSGIVEITGTTGDTIEITAIALGSVTITVMAGGKEASCEVKVLSEGELEYEWVDTYADLETAWSLAGGNSKKIEGNALTVGSFTFAVGIYFEDESTGISGMYDFNNQGKEVNIVLTGEMNNISFYAKTTSGTTSVNYYLFDAKDESEPLCTWTIVEGYADDYYTMTGKYLDKGEYILRTSANARIGELKISEYLEESEPESITATASTVDFLVGRTISESDLGIIITVNYANGSTRTVTSGFVTDIDDLTLDFGVHTVTVTYSFDDKFGSHQFSDEITIYLYEVESIEISDFSMEYTGGTYYTNNVQKIFLVGDSVNYSYAAVTATAYYMDGGTKVEATFILYDDEVYFGLYDEDNNKEVKGLDTAGTYTVRATVDMSYVTGKTVTATYQINVVSKEGADITTVKVGQAEDVSMDENGVYTVNTINDAIQLIKLLGASDAERKFIYVGEGEYDEKIYIDIPNLSLIGSNPSENENLATRSEVTEIVYDAMNGVMDPSGTTTYSTVGSATVTVASQATGFYAANITFRNYWNTNELYDEAKTITSSTQADAAYINADKAYFYNVTFTGYHDTLEAENGRQVYDHCYIEGRTDYIFGATATCYFKDCTIHSIGAGTDESNGGYVVAYKGNGNAGTVTYGYIFDGCTFEGDENVKEHSVALGRAWGEDMMMVIMNSKFDGSFAMGGYTGATSALRYCQMNYDPNFTKIYEYNNTGDSAIGSGTSGYSVDAASGLVTDSNGNSVFTIPSEEKAADFANMSVIFAATNGTVNYGSAWDGKCDVIKITVVCDNKILTTVYGTGSMSVSDLKTAINLRLSEGGVETIYSDNSMSAELTGNISSDMSVYISIGEKDMTVPESVTYDFSGADSTLNTSYANEWLGYLYIDAGTNGGFVVNGDWYLLYGDASITIKLSAGSYVTLEMYSAGGLCVNGENVTAEEGECERYWYTYTVTSGKTESVILSCSGSESLYFKTIRIEVPVIYQIGDTIDFTNIEGNDYNVSESGTGTYKGVAIEGYFRNNGNSVQVGVGTVLKIQSVPRATAKISFYQDDYWVEADIETDDTGLITITITNVSGNGGYIANIRITEDVDKVYQINEEINFVGVGDDEILSTTEGYDYNGVIITGSFRNNGNSFEVGEGTTIRIQSTPDASAEVVFYQNYTSELSVSTDENGLITIVFGADTGSNGIYICSITIVSNTDYGDESGEEPDVGLEDVYSGSIILASNEIEINVGEDGYIYFEVEVLLNGESFDGDVDIAVQADDTYFAVDSWDKSSDYIKVTGVSAGSTYVTITLSVNGTILDTAVCTVIVNTSSAGLGDEDESETVTNVYEFSYDELCQAMFGSGDVADGTQLSAEYFTGGNSFITYTGSSSSNKIRNSSNGSAIEVKGDCLTVTFEGTGTLTISFSSTGNKAENISTIGVKDSAGNYLSGEADETSEGYSNLIAHALSNGGCAYEISYNKFATVTFMVTEPGTYTIATCIATSLGFDVNDPNPEENNYSDNRAARINAIVMVDNIVTSDSTSGEDGGSSEKNFPDPDDAIHVVWDWEGRNEESQTVTVTIYSVEGELLTTETTTYDVDVNNPSYWYAEVSAGGITYASMYKIPGEGDAYSEESFIVPLAGSLEGISAQSFAENEQIEDNDLFTITAGVSLKYSGGTVSSSSTDGDANAEYGALQKGSNAISFTDMNGVVHNPDQGIVMSSAFTEKQDIDNIITITAKEDITLYVYVVFTNSSFNSNKKGKVYCTVNGGEKIGEEELSSRTALWSYGVNGISLTKGDVLVIGAEDSNGDKANFWFFGAEACTAGEKINYADVKTVIFYTNQTSIGTISKAVYNYSVVSAPVLPNVSGQYFVGWYMDAGCNVAYDFSEPVTSDLTLYAKWVTMDSEITYIQGTYEGISLEFTDSNPSGAKIMYKAISESSYTVMTDVDAIRLVGDTTVRVDIMGLQGDTYYNVKILTSGNEQLAEYKIYVSSYDRSGYAHFNYSDGVGAYEDDGTLKDGALVIYVTEENKNDVTNDIYKYSKDDDTYTKVEWSELSQYLKMTDSGDLANYNRFAGTDYDGYVKGIGEILNNSRYSSTGRKNVGIAALCSAYGAVDVRIIGEVTASLVSGEVYWGYDDEEKTDRWMVWGTYDIYGLSDLNPKADNSTDVNGGSHGDNGGLVLMRDAYNLTIEGVGEGAVLNGWGVTFMATEANTDENIETGKSFEVRNLTFVNYPEDAIGIQGTQQTVNKDKTQSYLTASAERIWVHNNTFYAGYCEYPAESDKGEGDGTCDFKRGQYFTLSYNYFEGCHKTDLFGADNDNLQFNISMHHNFWHNCQSRIPMTRNSNIHYYNNYVLVDDTTNIQYVMDARADAYIYAEYNYFEGCVDVFRSYDGTGTIKSYGNELVNCTTTSNSQNITPTTAETREEKVENNCGYWYYGIDYSSFDTDSTLFYYDAAKGRSDCYLTSAEEAKEEVVRTAGALSREKFTSCEQYIRAADIVKPTAPEFNLELESPDENDGTDGGNSAGISECVIPYTESTKRYA